MVNGTVETTKVVTLKLSEIEARWLKGLCQNQMVCVMDDVVSEDLQASTIRAAIFNAIQLD